MKMDGRVLTNRSGCGAQPLTWVWRHEATIHRGRWQVDAKHGDCSWKSPAARYWATAARDTPGGGRGGGLCPGIDMWWWRDAGRGGWWGLASRSRSCCGRDASSTSKPQSAQAKSDRQTTRCPWNQWHPSSPLRATDWGEWQWEMKREDCQGDSNDDGRDLQPWQAWLTMVHQGLRKVIFEEKSLTDYENVGEVVMQAEKQVEEMERALRKIEALQQKAVQEECLVTRTVDLAEVRGSLEEWREAIKSEYESLLAHGAIEPISGKEFEELRASEVEIEMIPAKLVATVKPPSRKKARLVGCGNMATCTETDLAASGIDTIGVRALISNTAIRQWDLAVADVKTAFLQAPRRKVEGKCTYNSGTTTSGQGPDIMGYGKDEKWVVRGALYGLAESPKDWGSYRDGRLRTMTWEKEGQRFHVEATVSQGKPTSGR